jgi:hypothetical protein
LNNILFETRYNNHKKKDTRIIIVTRVKMVSESASSVEGSIYIGLGPSSPLSKIEPKLPALSGDDILFGIYVP